jgi:DNA-binding NtrC family response regulator
MRGKTTALLIFHHPQACRELAAILEKLAFCTRRVKTLAEARHVLAGVNPPLLVFTESESPDGNWADVLSLSVQASAAVTVVVVGQQIDTMLYASVIEVGGFDFIAPPYNAVDLTHVVRCAADHALARRQAAKKAISSVFSNFPPPSPTMA